MVVLALGDVITPGSVAYLEKNLWNIRKKYGVDLCIVNGENASFLAGIGPEGADTLFSCGADVITGGNHSLQNRSVYAYMDGHPNILRPLNFPCDVAGNGATVVDINGYRVLVANAMGTAFIEPQLDSPYPHLSRMLERYAGDYDISILDFHAEASGEKVALGHYFDGKFALIFGTHTHVPTADEQILAGGTGYITDIGCTAPTGGILGVNQENLLARYRTKTPVPYKPASGPIRAEGVLAVLDEKTNRCISIKRISF